MGAPRGAPAITAATSRVLPTPTRLGALRRDRGLQEGRRGSSERPLGLI